MSWKFRKDLKRIVRTLHHALLDNPAKRVSIRRRVVSLSLPVLLSALFQRLVSIIDIFMVGGLGAAAIAAVGIGQFLIFMAMTVFWGLSTDTTVVIAHLWGGGRHQDARKAAFAALLTCLVMIAAATACGAGFGSRLAHFMGAGADVMAHADRYIRLVFLYFGFTAGLNILSGVLHGRGNTRTPMEAILLVNILHVVIAWPLIYGKFGFPQLGVIGAAYAINLSEAVGFFYLLFQAVRKGCISFGTPDFGLWQRIWSVGYPVALERIAQQSGQLLRLSWDSLWAPASTARRGQATGRPCDWRSWSWDSWQQFSCSCRLRFSAFSHPMPTLSGKGPFSSGWSPLPRSLWHCHSSMPGVCGAPGIRFTSFFQPC